jgi:hypothetical protein
MHWQRNANVDVRTLSTNSDIACQNEVLSRSTVSNPCATTAHQKLTSGTCTVSLIEGEGLRSELVSFYPNPLTNDATLTVSGELAAEGVEFTIRDLSGREVQKSMISAAVTRIVPGDYPDGIYFYTVKKGDEIISSGKFVISGN